MSIEFYGSFFLVTLKKNLVINGKVDEDFFEYIVKKITEKE